MFDFVLHWHGQIRFAIECPRDGGDSAPGNELTHENDAAPPCVSRFLAHVETQIHFFEISVERNGQAEESRVEKKETDDADECLAVLEIDLRSWRDERRKDRWIDDVIQHREITPVSAEEGFHGRKLRINNVTVTDRRHRINRQPGGRDSGAPFFPTREQE